MGQHVALLRGTTDRSDQTGVGDPRKPAAAIAQRREQGKAAAVHQQLGRRISRPMPSRSMSPGCATSSPPAASTSVPCAASAIAWMSRRQSDRTGRILSISQRLLLILMIPLAAVLAVSVLADYRLASSPAEDALDHALEDAALAVTAHLRFSDGAMQLEFSPLSDMILRSDQVDEVYFAVIDSAGRARRRRSGPPWSDRGGGNPAYFDASHRGRAIRGVVLRAVTDAGPATIVVAETTVKRDAGRPQHFRGNGPAQHPAHHHHADPRRRRRALWAGAPGRTAQGNRSALAARPASPAGRGGAAGDAAPGRRPEPSVPADRGILRRHSSASWRMRRTSCARPWPHCRPSSNWRRRTTIRSRSGRASKRIGEATRRVSRLTTQLLALAKSEPAANITAQLQDLDLPEVHRGAGIGPPRSRHRRRHRSRIRTAARACPRHPLAGQRTAREPGGQRHRLHAPWRPRHRALRRARRSTVHRGGGQRSRDSGRGALPAVRALLPRPRNTRSPAAVSGSPSSRRSPMPTAPRSNSTRPPTARARGWR
ncbi:MAG: sensor histidine kinase N-terminal domain-containing protein [Chromatiales bacterium]|nr:sensor histidine kinase N-terminal domain-containing protein [Chromatiales bacterium]